MENFHTEMPNQFNLPRRIARLGKLAYNLWWTWNPEAQRLFLRIDPILWERAYHNPVRFLRMVPKSRLKAMTRDQYYLDFYDRTFKAFDEYMQPHHTWTQQAHSEYRGRPIAYLSSEFGLHETLPIYAGGLGVLSGDHIKAASDLGLPFVALGFLYTQGYFFQHITEDGWQEARNVVLRFDELPVMPVLNVEGQPATVSVELAGREVHACLWQVQVGRCPLYLLDTNVEANSPTDRDLTARLYTSDLDLRISQEMILGIGGVRALRMLGYNPAVWHMNEGHSGFMALERCRELVAAGRNFEEASQIVKASTVFTTHTPVPAGNDEFPLWLIDKYFYNYWPQLGLEREAFIDIARHTQPWGDMYSMPILALRLSEARNAVARRHGEVSRTMWSFLWPGTPVAEVPITHVTNGIHTGTWMARRLRNLFNRYLGDDWINRVDDPEIWQNLDDIPDEELWAVRLHLKRKLVAYMRERIRELWIVGGVHPVQVVAGGVMLNPYALTIGFARRFATYKRASLVLRDVDRLFRIVNRADMPVQIIFAGKSHPNDEPGKLLIQEVYRVVKKAENGGRLVFLEDYDMNLARYLIQGVDVWMNTPRPPNEASGTSGMKAALNGALNFSILDGWWHEGYNSNNGWTIGSGIELADPWQQDEADAQSLYEILENEIIPLYYDRSADDLPGEWIGRMKESMRSLIPQFSMHRMVKEYCERLYYPPLPE